MPVILALQEDKAGGLLKPRSLRQASSGKKDSEEFEFQHSHLHEDLSICPIPIFRSHYFPIKAFTLTADILLGWCCVLNADVSFTQIHMLELNPQCDSIKGGAFGERLNQEGSALMNGMHVLIK